MRYLIVHRPLVTSSFMCTYIFCTYIYIYTCRVYVSCVLRCTFLQTMPCTNCMTLLFTASASYYMPSPSQLDLPLAGQPSSLPIAQLSFLLLCLYSCGICSCCNVSHLACYCLLLATKKWTRLQVCVGDQLNSD